MGQVHRSITSAALVVATVAGLAGCVRVTPPSHHDKGGTARLVEAPAREALDRLRRPTRTPRPHRSTATPRSTPRHESGRHGGHRHVPLPRVPVPQPPLHPALPPGYLTRQPDACALGRDFDRYQDEGHKVHLC